MDIPPRRSYASGFQSAVSVPPPSNVRRAFTSSAATRWVLKTRLDWRRARSPLILREDEPLVAVVPPERNQHLKPLRITRRVAFASPFAGCAVSPQRRIALYWMNLWVLGGGGRTGGTQPPP